MLAGTFFAPRHGITLLRPGTWLCSVVQQLSLLCRMSWIVLFGQWNNTKTKIYLSIRYKSSWLPLFTLQPKYLPNTVIIIQTYKYTAREHFGLSYVHALPSSFFQTEHSGQFISLSSCILLFLFHYLFGI
jgi:hypothetical protein